MKDFSDSVKGYIDGVKSLLDEIPQNQIEEITEVILNAYRSGKNVFILGNGGSASTASHFACDLNKTIAVEGKARLKAMSLTDNVALMTAICNDINYDSVFKEPLVGFLNNGDVVICISASGNSPNVLEAARYAKSKRAVVIGFIGFDGGTLREIADNSIVLYSDDYGQVEGVHSVLTHLISREVGRRIKDEG